MTTIEKIRTEIEFERDKKIGGEAFEAVQYKSFDKCLQIIDKYASEECDNDCEHCAYIECPKGGE